MEQDHLNSAFWLCVLFFRILYQCNDNGLAATCGITENHILVHTFPGIPKLYSWKRREIKKRNGENFETLFFPTYTSYNLVWNIPFCATRIRPHLNRAGGVYMICEKISNFWTWRITDQDYGRSPEKICDLLSQLLILFLFHMILHQTTPTPAQQSMFTLSRACCHSQLNSTQSWVGLIFLGF